MAKDTSTFIKALGLEQVDILGFSIGGMVAQELALQEGDLVRQIIMAGTRLNLALIQIQRSLKE